MVELNRRTLLGGALAGVAGSALLPDIASAGDGFSWKDFIGSSDLIWKKMPTTWFDGPYLGNGFLGSGIYAEPNANAIRFNVQHSQVQDHRPEFGALFGLARLPIGYFTLEPVGAIRALGALVRIAAGRAPRRPASSPWPGRSQCRSRSRSPRRSGTRTPC